MSFASNFCVLSLACSLAYFLSISFRYCGWYRLSNLYMEMQTAGDRLAESLTVGGVQLYEQFEMRGVV